MGQRNRSFFIWGMLVAGLPLCLLTIPLFFHKSPEVTQGNYSGSYLLFLGGAVASAILLTLLVARRCDRKQSLFAAGYLNFLLGLGLVLFFLSEIYLTRTLTTRDVFDEYREWGHVRSQFTGFEAGPNNSWGSGGMYTTDKFGFRTHVNNPWLDSPGPRIFALGESSTFGFSLNDSQTWAHLLEGNLRNKFNAPNLNVINAGNNGFNSLQNLIRFHLKVRPHKPRTIVYYAGRNDVYSGRATLETTPHINQNVLTAPSVADFWIRQSKGQNLYVRSLSYYFLIIKVPFLHHLQWWQRTREQRASLLPAAYADTASEQLPVSAAVKDILKDLPANHVSWLDYIVPNSLNVVLVHVGALCDLAAQAGARVVLTTFLQNFEKGDPMGITIRVYNQHLREYAERKGYPLVDIEKQFEPVGDKAKYFADAYHPSALGAEFIAKSLADAWQPAWTEPLS